MKVEATETKVKKSVQKGTPKTELIIGTSAGKLNAAHKAILEALQQSDKLVEILNDNALKIADSEEKLVNLGVEYTQTKAENDFRLQMEWKQDRANLVNSHLTQEGLTAIPTDKLNSLNNELATLKNDFQQKLNKEVATITASVRKDYENTSALKDSEFKVKEAQNAATINQLQAQLTSAIETASMWKEQLIAEREAGIKRAEASSINSINVGTTAK